MQITTLFRQLITYIVVIAGTLILLVTLTFPLWGFGVFSASVMTAVIVAYLWLSIGVVLMTGKSHDG